MIYAKRRNLTATAYRSALCVGYRLSWCANSVVSFGGRHMGVTNRSGVQSVWDFVNMGFAFAVHAVMAALGWFVMSHSVEDSALNISVQGLGIVLG
jgi:hypothetical protein